MDDINRIIRSSHRFVEDDWNNSNDNATHNIEPSSSSLLCIGNNNISNNSTTVPSIPCSYPNGTTNMNTTTNHTLPPNFYGGSYSSSTTKNNSRDTTEGMIVGAIFSCSMITSLLLSKYLYKRYKASTTTTIQQDYDVNNTSIHSNNRSHYRHHHNSITITETIKKISIQDQYTKLEASLCSLYVMEHNTEYCHHHHHHDIIVDNALHQTNYENDDVIDNQQYTYDDIESSYGKQQLLYDINDSFKNINNKQSQSNVLNSSVHSITTSCSSCSGCTCNNSTCIDNDVNTKLHDRNECPICLDQFQVGQIVSMSPSLCSCQHIFHHICIKEWLLKNDTCPSCRQIYFNDDNIDNMNSIIDDENINHNNIIVINDHNDIDEHNTDNKTITTSESIMKKNDVDNHNMIMFYCIRHGISYCLSPSINHYNLNQALMIPSSLSLNNNNSIADNDDTRNQVHHDPNFLSVPTSTELSYMRIQQEQPTISLSSKQQHIIDRDDDIPVHHDDTINNHHGGTNISNRTTISTDRYIQYYL